MPPSLRVLTLLAATACFSHAQWVSYPSPGTPRLSGGKPNLAASAPRAPGGKPDLSGLWQVEPTPLSELTALFGDMTKLDVPGDDSSIFNKYFLNILSDFKRGEEPMRPEAAAIFRQRGERNGKDVPTTHCLPAGVPLANLYPFPFKIVQTPSLLLVLYEGDESRRQIYTDGRKPPADPDPLWLGYSVGRWEGDALVVDTTGFNDKTWLDVLGHPHSDALHVVERFRRRDFGHLDVAVTIDDSKMYTRPFSVKYTERLLPDSDLLEFFCAENEKDWNHMAGR